MITTQLNTDKAKAKFEKMPQNILSNVSRESHMIMQEVHSQALNEAPVWNDILRHTVLYRSEPFKEVTESRVSMTLRYDAFNPRTGFHYGLLRHEQTSSGVPYWAKRGMEASSPLIEKTLANAVKRGVK